MILRVLGLRVRHGLDEIFVASPLRVHRFYAAPIPGGPRRVRPGRFFGDDGGQSGGLGDAAKFLTARRDVIDEQNMLELG